MPTPDPNYLLQKAGIDLPLIGLYDTADPEGFKPLVGPSKGKWACIFMFYNNWLKGKSLHLTPDNNGCGGVGTYLFGLTVRSRKDYIDFLQGDEGLKANPEAMGEWMDEKPPYMPANKNMIIGPLKEDHFEELKTITFLINPDQLSLLVTGAYYNQGPNEPARVKVPFASGCGLMGPFFEDLEKPQAIIGATDIAMRKYLPPDIIAFTVTKPMYEELCALDEKSFLNKPFWKDVVKKRSREE